MKSHSALVVSLNRGAAIKRRDHSLPGLDAGQEGYVDCVSFYTTNRCLHAIAFDHTAVEDGWLTGDSWKLGVSEMKRLRIVRTLVTSGAKSLLASHSR